MKCPVKTWAYLSTARHKCSWRMRRCAAVVRSRKWFRVVRAADSQRFRPGMNAMEYCLCQLFLELQSVTIPGSLRCRNNQAIICSCARFEMMEIVRLISRNQHVQMTWGQHACPIPYSTIILANTRDPTSSVSISMPIHFYLLHS